MGDDAVNDEVLDTLAQWGVGALGEKMDRRRPDTSAVNPWCSRPDAPSCAPKSGLSTMPTARSAPLV
ncbi:MAG: hypothetical protein EBY51_04045 [Actinobacteria bacterium]|nr:hypothetical protein [Actinomycetota bacterium]